MFKYYCLLQNNEWTKKSNNDRLHYFNGTIVSFSLIHNLTGCTSVMYDRRKCIVYYNADWLENTRKG